MFFIDSGNQSILRIPPEHAEDTASYFRKLRKALAAIYMELPLCRYIGLPLESYKENIAMYITISNNN